MSRKPKPPKGSKILANAKRLEAKMIAVRLFAKLASDVEVAEAIEKEYGCSKAVAQAVTQEAWEMAWQYNDNRTLRERTNAALLQAQELARTLIQSKSPAALAALKYTHQLQGILVDKKPEHNEVLESKDDEFDRRSNDELKFFQKHGCWPEEYREPAKHQGAVNPLDKLEKLEAMH